jgi:hypothetical protein
VGAPARTGAVRRARPGPRWTRRGWLPSWRAPPGPSWSCPTRTPNGTELELSDARTTGAELGAATMAATPARVSGAELELSDARTTGAELELSDVSATGPRWTRRGWLPSWRAPPGPSWSCPTCAHHRGRDGRGEDGCRPGARHGAELERFEVAPTTERALSDARTPARAGAVGRAHPIQAVRACWQTPERNWPSLDPHRPLFGERTWNELPNLQRTPPSRCRCRRRSWVRHCSKGACDSGGA